MKWELISSGKNYSSMAASMAGIGTLVESYGYLIEGGGMRITRTVSPIGEEHIYTKSRNMSQELIAQAMLEFRTMVPAPTEANLTRIQEIKEERQRQDEEYMAQARAKQRRLEEVALKQEQLRNKYGHI